MPYFAVNVEGNWEYFAARDEGCVRKHYEASGMQMPGRVKEISREEASKTTMFVSFQKHRTFGEDGTYMLGKKNPTV